jgi:hypothetical protein
MTEQHREDSPDGVVFRCTRCKKRTSIRAGSVLEGAHIKIEEFLAFVYLMTLEVSQVTIGEVLMMDPNTVMAWQTKIRAAYSKRMLEVDIEFGTRDAVVEIDESVILRAKPTRNRHARPRPTKWVFAMFDRRQNAGVIKLVPNRSADVLVPIIQEHCTPGAVIYSDGWQAYRFLNDLGFNHQTVVHRDYFVDPETGVHTNNVESFWKRFKTKFKRMNGVAPTKIESYIDEFLWLERFGRTVRERFGNTIIDFMRVHEDF